MSCMSDLIVIPKNGKHDATHFDKEQQFGYFETQNYEHRDEHEDALAWHLLSAAELTPANSNSPLTANEIGHRLWTTYQILDNPSLKSGTTATSTVYNGNNHLITATVGDAAAFAVIYDKAGVVQGVTKLNSVTHKLTDPIERERIIKAGGNIKNDRVMGLQLSRAIGDNLYKTSGVCADAHINIHRINVLTQNLNLKEDQVGSIQVIVCCDGFTDAAGEQLHEHFLLDCIKSIDNASSLPEDLLAKQLVTLAKDKSYDNITLAIQRLNLNQPFLLGVFDGHGGNRASTFVAKNLGLVFKQQCALSQSDYDASEKSTVRKTLEYTRDNTDTTLGEELVEEIKANSPTNSARFFQASNSDPIFDENKVKLRH